MINVEEYEELQATTLYTPYITAYIDGYPWKLQDGNMTLFIGNIIQEFVDKALETDIERVEEEDWDIIENYS